MVPPVLEKSPFGRFDDQFVRQRRSVLGICVNKIANHPVLCKDADLKLFLESDTIALDVCTTDVLNKMGISSVTLDRSSTVKRNSPTNAEA